VTLGFTSAVVAIATSSAATRSSRGKATGVGVEPSGVLRACVQIWHSDVLEVPSVAICVGQSEYMQLWSSVHSNGARHIGVRGALDAPTAVADHMLLAQSCDPVRRGVHLK
jgi:hypothetical protein